MAQVIGYRDPLDWNHPFHSTSPWVLVFAVFSSKCSPCFSQSHPWLLCLHPHEIGKQSSLLSILPSYHLITHTLLVWSLALLFTYSNAAKWKIQDFHERIWICLLKIRYSHMNTCHNILFPMAFYGHKPVVSIPQSSRWLEIREGKPIAFSVAGTPQSWLLDMSHIIPSPKKLHVSQSKHRWNVSDLFMLGSLLGVLFDIRG